MVFFKSKTDNYRVQAMVLAEILEEKIREGRYLHKTRLLEELNHFVNHEWLPKPIIHDLQNYIILLNHVERLDDSLKFFVTTYPGSKSIKNLASRLALESMHFIFSNLHTANNYLSDEPDDTHGINHLSNTLEATRRLLAKPNTRHLNATIESIQQLEKYKDNRSGPFKRLLHAIYQASLLIVVSIMQVIPGMKSIARRVRNSSYDTFHHFHKKNLHNFEITYFKKIASSKKQLKKLTQELQPLIPKPRTKKATEIDELLAAPTHRKIK